MSVSQINDASALSDAPIAVTVKGSDVETGVRRFGSSASAHSQLAMRENKSVFAPEVVLAKPAPPYFTDVGMVNFRTKSFGFDKLIKGWAYKPVTLHTFVRLNQGYELTRVLTPWEPKTQTLCA